MCDNKSVVKAEAESKMRMIKDKRKVNFTPTEDSLKRMEKTYHRDHV